jgi:hypothetical protein
VRQSRRGRFHTKATEDGTRRTQRNVDATRHRELAEVFVAEVGDGLLVEVGVIGVEGIAEGGVH